MAKAKAKSIALPLDDPRWWPIDRAFQYRRRQVGDDTLAVADIRLVVESQDLPTKVEAFNRLIKRRVSQCVPWAHSHTPSCHPPRCPPGWSFALAITH
jgi:hypothetical protein